MGGGGNSTGIIPKVNLGEKGGGDQHTQNGDVMRQILFTKE